MKFSKKAALFSALLLSAAISAHAADDPLQKAVQDGKKAFSSETFGGKGKTCNACHTNDGVGPGKLPNGKVIPSLSNAAAIFPRYNQRAKKVVTLEDQIRSCVKNALQGMPPAAGSEKLTDIAAYITSLSQGKPIDMGGKPE
ncbi:MAG TPA: c-type cytochrome [Burkholderiales bacterium]|nr:c-type cytochrome [Burkholderiales bacterium]